MCVYAFFSYRLYESAQHDKWIPFLPLLFFLFSSILFILCILLLSPLVFYPLIFKQNKNEKRDIYFVNDVRRSKLNSTKKIIYFINRHVRNNSFSNNKKTSGNFRVVFFSNSATEAAKDFRLRLCAFQSQSVRKFIIIASSRMCAYRQQI